MLPVSAFVAVREVMDVFTPGSHGSTFGGNPLAAAVGLEALRVLRDEGLVERSRDLGAHMIERLRAIDSPVLTDVRGRGLWAAAEINPRFSTGREACERLMAKRRAVEGDPRCGGSLRAAARHHPRGPRPALDRFEDVVGELEHGQSRRPAA